MKNREHEFNRLMALLIKSGKIEDIFRDAPYNKRLNMHGPVMGVFLSGEFLEEIKRNPEFYLKQFEES